MCPRALRRARYAGLWAGALLVGCAPVAGGADGLKLAQVDAGFHDQRPTAGDASELLGDDCKQLAAFNSFARPAFVADCLRCHDGNKTLATKDFDLRPLEDMSPEGQRLACSNVMLNVVLGEPASSPILTSVNPDDLTTEHEFKYANSAMFSAYRAAIMKWLENE